MEGHHAAEHDRRNFLQRAARGLGVIALTARPLHARAQTTTAAPLKIGMVGAGRMGGAVGALLVKAGYPVFFSSRHPENLKDLTARLGPLAQAGPVQQAVAFGDVVVMVVPYAALEEIGKAHGPALAAKPLVMDVCNPIARRDGEAIVQWVNGEIAHRAGGLVGVPIAGDDPKAITLAENLIRGMGFEPVLVGGLAMGKYLLPGTPLAEEHTPAEIRQIAAGLR